MTPVLLFFAVMTFVGVWAAWVRHPGFAARVPEGAGAFVAMTVGLGSLVVLWAVTA